MINAASPEVSRKRHLTPSAPKNRNSTQSPTLSSTANSSENDSRMDRWYKALRNDHGRERLHHLNFASVRKNDKLLVRPCHFKDVCDCRRYGTRFVTVETITGYKSHLESNLLDLNSPLPIYCPICPRSRSSFSRNSQFLDHIKKDHLADNVRSLIRSTPPYKCPFFNSCRFVSKTSTNEVLNHFLDPSEKHGSTNFIKVFFAQFIGSDPRSSSDQDRHHDERKRRSTMDEEVITSTAIDGPSPLKMVKYEDRRELNELRSNNEKLTAKLNQHQHQLSVMNGEKSRFSQRVEELEISQRDYLEKISCLERELATKDEQSSKETDKNAELLKQTSKKCESYRKKFKDAMTDLEKLRKECIEKNAKIAEMNENLVSFSKQLAAEVDEKKDIQATVDKLNKDVSQIKCSQECQAEKERQHKQGSEQSKVILEITDKCNNAEKDISGLKMREKALSEEIIDLKEEMKCKNETIFSIQAKADEEIESAKKTIEKLEDKNVNLLQRIGTMSNSDQVINELREQVVKKRDDNVKVVLRLKETSKQIEAKNQEIAKLKKLLKLRNDEIALYQQTKTDEDDDQCNQSDGGGDTSEEANVSIK